MTNWQHAIHQSVESLATGEGSNFGYAYIERQDTRTYLVQSYAPLEEMKLNFTAAIRRLIEIANQTSPKIS